MRIKVIKESEDNQNIKHKQLAIIKATNPMQDDIHTGIRTIKDISFPEEVFSEDNFEGLYPDFTLAMAKKSIKIWKNKSL